MTKKNGFKTDKRPRLAFFQLECVGVRLLWETDGADLPSWYHGLEGEAAGLLKGPLGSFRSDAEQLFEVCRQLRGAKGPVEWISHDPGLAHTSIAV